MGQDSGDIVLPEREPFRETMFGTTKESISPADKISNAVLKIWDGPITWFRESVVLPLRPKTTPKYYHQKFRRVPTVDECYEDDVACIFEAHEQYKRDRKVETKIVDILRQRWGECMQYHGHDQAERCEAMKREFLENETNWFVKYGDVCMYTNCSAAYYKQVHRLIWERRQKEKAKLRAEQELQ